MKLHILWSNWLYIYVCSFYLERIYKVVIWTQSFIEEIRDIKLFFVDRNNKFNVKYAIGKFMFRIWLKKKFQYILLIVSICAIKTFTTIAPLLTFTLSLSSMVLYTGGNSMCLLRQMWNNQYFQQIGLSSPVLMNTMLGLIKNKVVGFD